MPIGTLIDEDRRPADAWVSMPPSSTPDVPPSRAIAPQTPSARLRSAPSANEVVMIARVAGEITRRRRPAARARRAAGPCESASAQTSDASANSAVADEEHAPAAEQVRGAPAEHQEAGERERVGVDDPLEAGGREAEPVADRRQRDVDDRHVEDDHELGAGTRPAAGAVCAGRSCRSRCSSVCARLSRYKRRSYPGSRQHHPNVATTSRRPRSRSSRTSCARAARRAARGRRAAQRRPAPHAGPAPRGGRPARRRRHHLVHVARAGPRRARVARRARGARARAAPDARRARPPDAARPR